MPRRSFRSELASLALGVARPLGMLLLVLAACMVLCGLVGKLFEEGWRGVFALSVAALITAAAGAALAVVGRGRTRIGRREALLVVSLSWLSAGVFGGLPFVFGASFTPWDAFFESTSGFTTTGATILTEIETRLDAPLHLWRTLTHWLGGLGLVVLFVAIFPALGVGGRHLYHSEAPGPKSDGLVPRIRDVSKVLWRIYLVLTLLEMGLLAVVGMDPFNAIAHALSTMGTGGFSTKNASVAGFNSVAIEMVILVFMLLAGTNFGIFHDALRHGWRSIARNTELRVYATLFLVVTLVVALDILAMKDGFLEALRYGSFQVATIMTTTGFGTDDFETWPALSRTLLVGLYFVGGSAGSTAGGMKVIRIIILVSVVMVEIRRAHRPNLVAPVLVGGRAFSPEAVMEVAGFAGMWMLTLLAGAAAVAFLDRTDLTTSFMASLACVANVGPGLGTVGPVDNYGHFSVGTKLVLPFCMILGRLEFLTLLALLNPRFWKR